MPKPLPLGEVARRRRDGEGKPVSQELPRSDKHWLLIESSYRCIFVLSQHPCPLRRYAPAPPKGEPLACRSGFHWTSKARCPGNGSAPLSRPATAWQGALVQKLLPSVARPALLRHIGPQASSGKLPGLPKALPLGELSPKVTERARPLTKNRRRSDSIALPKRQLIAAWRLPGDGLALSVTADAVPLPGLRLPASASLPLASCWPRPQQLLPVSATGGGRRRCSQGERLWLAEGAEVRLMTKI